MPAADQAKVQLIGNIQRELSRKGFYDGPADGIWGAKTDSAVRDFVSATGSKINPEANDGLLKPSLRTRQSRRPSPCRRARPRRSDREADRAVQEA